MPTTLRSFPEQSRTGTQQTPYRAVPEQFDYLQLTLQGQDAELSDESNQIVIDVLVSPDGQNATAIVIQRYIWFGGMYTPKGGGNPIPKSVDLTFGPFTRWIGHEVSIRAAFNRPITVGATLTGLP
jgi:hypothetical protein